MPKFGPQKISKVEPVLPITSVKGQTVQYDVSIQVIVELYGNILILESWYTKK